MNNQTRSESIGSDLLTVVETGRLLNVSRWTVRRLIDAGQLPLVRLPKRTGAVRRLLIARRDVEALIDRCRELES